MDLLKQLEPAKSAGIPEKYRFTNSIIILGQYAKYGPLVQLVERSAHNREVVGSSPTWSIYIIVKNLFLNKNFCTAAVPKSF